MALGTNLSALWILIANGWMQHPVGAVFNPDTMRMEVTDFAAVLFNPTAQAKFVHTVSAGYVCGAAFVLGVSAFYILRGRHIDLAKRSFVIASAFGVAVRPLGHRAGRRKRIHHHRQPENEARRHRGDVADRAGAGVLHRVRPSGHAGARHQLRHPHSLGDRPYRHTVDRRANPRNSRSGAVVESSYPERLDRLCGAAETEDRTMPTLPRGAPSTTPATIWAMRCC